MGVAKCRGFSGNGMNGGIWIGDSQTITKCLSNRARRTKYGDMLHSLLTF